MSIAERIASMSNNLSDAYDGIEYLGVDITGVDKNLQNLSSMLNVVYEGLPKVSDEGVSPSIDGSRVGRLKSTLKASDTTQANTILPSEYTQVDYIESSGTQYIDTGYKPYKTKTEIKFALTSTENDKALIGAFNQNDRYYPVLVRNNNIEILNKLATTVYSIPTDTNVHTVVYNDKNNNCFLDNINAGTVSNLTEVSSNNIYLFARKGNTAAEKLTNARIYYVKIWEENVLVRNFIPCYRNSDNEVGLFDIVNNVFYTNRGTGDFTYGQVVSIPNPDYPQDIHTIKGNNTVEVCGENLYNTSSYEIWNLSNALPSAKVSGVTINSADNNNVNFTVTVNNYRILLSQIYFLKANSSYTIFFKRTDTANNPRAYIYDVDENNKYTINTSFSNQTGDISATFTTNEYGKVAFAFGVGNTDKDKTIDIANIMIATSQDTTYEIYNGTKNPVNLPVQNFLPTDESAWEQGAISSASGINIPNSTRIRTIDYYPIKNDIDYYVSVQDTNYCFVSIFLYDSSKNFIETYYNIDYSISGATSLKINIPSSTAPNVAYMRSVLRTATSDTILPSAVSTIKPMIELGNKANRYTPYGATPIELCKINTYQDKLFKAISGDTVYDSLTSEQKEGLVSGGWYKYGDYGKVILNGTQSLTATQTVGVFWTTNNDYLGGTNNVISISDRYIGHACVTQASTITGNYSTTFNKDKPNYPRLYIKDVDCTTVSDLSTKLSNKNAIIYYQLETPTITQITDSTLVSQLENLYSAMSKNGQTNILQTNTDLPFIISASALKGE